MMSRKTLRIGLVIVLVALIAVGAVTVLRNTVLRPKTITAYFTTATAIYPGDDVRVSGMKVGKIAAIHPEGTQAKMVMHVGKDVPIPANAKAVIVAQNLVAARYVQLTPAYRSSGPTMGDGAVIPVERTAIPVEWDEVKDQLMRLATDLGPSSTVSSSSIGRFIDSAADALGGNGQKLRQTLTQLSGLGRTLADGSGNIVETIKNLQTFVTALRDSGQQLMQFNNRLATLSSVLDDNRSDLDAALNNLATAIPEVQRFIAGTRDKTSEQLARLTDVTQVLADQKMALENIMHVTPNALANGYSDYNPDTGAIRGAFGFNNLSNAVWAICSNMGAIENATATESGKLCAQYAGPALRVVNPFTFLAFGFLPNFNYLYMPLNLFLQKSADPQNIAYSEARLAPGGEGPKPVAPDLPPAVSAYTGLPGDPVGPPGAVPPARIPGAAMPQPPAPSVPEESPPPPPPPPPPADLPGMLLPAERPQP